MIDLIDREAILKDIEKIRQSVQMMDDTHRASITMNGVWLCEKAVRNQPSAQPKKGSWEHCEDEDGMYDVCSKWIPVAERLPEFKERVLVYAEDDKSWYIAISQMLSLSPLKGCFLGFYGTQKVKAWMPLPEPYKAESEDKE